jgi:hypothetical protein
MGVRIYGPHPLNVDEAGQPACRIATVFPCQNAVVTLPGIHATQRLDFFDLLNEQRAAAGLSMLSTEETTSLSEGSVDIVREDDALLIRPDPGRMQAALAADEILQDLVPKWQIRYLNTHDDRVWGAIKRRGECWRTAPEPASMADMHRLIHGSRKAIDRGTIYYYSRATGSHLLTFTDFVCLDQLDDEALREQLIEISSYSHEKNRGGHDEVVLFGASPELKAELQLAELISMPSDEVRRYYHHLRGLFSDRVPDELRVDDPSDHQWRVRMYRALVVPPRAPAPEEVRLGLSSEFHMQIAWLPGGRIDDGHLKWDSVFNQEFAPWAQRKCDPNVKGFLIKLFREYEDLDYVNVGRVAEPLSSRPRSGGRRGFYVAEIMRHGDSREIVKVIRMQKWDVAERLDEDKDLLQAILESEEYAEYVLDRWVACRQLGMQLPAQLSSGKLAETYRGKQHRYRGARIWASFFMRDYVQGVATDKIPPGRFADDGFAMRFARMLGQAAAVNMVVGRCDPTGRVLFDDGDEILVEAAAGKPDHIIVADHTGAFADYRTDLSAWAEQYVQPVLRRIEHVGSPERFCDAYLNACIDTFVRLQHDYQQRRSAFDRLFKHRPREQAGSFGYRWERVLRRLEDTDVQELCRAMLQALQPVPRALA